MKVFISILFLTLFSCSHLETDERFAQMSADQVLDLISLEGEGRGRISVKEQQYLFSFESLLNQEFDWILAVSIPIHGEELMTFKNLKLEREINKSNDSFELRMNNEILSQFQDVPQISPKIVRELNKDLRNLIRLVFSKRLKVYTECSGRFPLWACLLDQSKFELKVESGQLKIEKSIGDKFLIELQGLNLTSSFFGRTNINFYSVNEYKQRFQILSLELFWNNQK